MRDLDVQVPGSSMSLSCSRKYFVGSETQVRYICELQGRLVNCRSSSIMGHSRSVASPSLVSLRTWSLAWPKCWGESYTCPCTGPASRVSSMYPEANHHPNIILMNGVLRPYHLPKDTAYTHCSQVYPYKPVCWTPAAPQSSCSLLRLSKGWQGSGPVRTSLEKKKLKILDPSNTQMLNCWIQPVFHPKDTEA